MKDGIVISGVSYELTDCDIVEGRVSPTLCDRCDFQRTCDDSQEQYCELFTPWTQGENAERVFKKVEHNQHSGINLIAAEREQQITRHNKTISHDLNINKYGQLRQMARLLLSYVDENVINDGFLKPLSPIGWFSGRVYRFASKTYKDRLIIAGALIAAEIDRISVNDEKVELIKKE